MVLTRPNLWCMLQGVYRATQMAKRTDWNDVFRRRIKASGLTIYRLSKDSGVNVAPLQRFMSGTHGMTLETASKIALLIGLELRVSRNRKGR